MDLKFNTLKWIIIYHKLQLLYYFATGVKVFNGHTMIQVSTFFKHILLVKKNTPYAVYHYALYYM